MSHIVIADWTPILITTDHDPNIFAGVYRVLAVIVESTLSLVTLMYHISQDSVLWLVLVNVYSQLLMFSRGTRNIWTKEMKTTDLISSPITAMWQPVQFFSSKHSSLWKLYCLALFTSLLFISQLILKYFLSIWIWNLKWISCWFGVSSVSLSKINNNMMLN